MKRTSKITRASLWGVFTLFFVFASVSHVTANPNIIEIDAGNLYVVHSESVDVHGTKPVPSLTSNIYVIKGVADNGKTQVWIFGAGYGNPGGDVFFYKNQEKDATNNAAFDVSNVEDVIQNDFLLDPANVVIEFITPHGHLDHINQEFFTELRNAHYKLASIYVHTNDYYISTCNAPFCNQGSSYKGAPYDTSWDGETLAKFVKLPDLPADICWEEVLTFPTEGLGTVEVKHTQGHTAGTLSLVIPDEKLLLRGSAQIACTTPPNIAQYEEWLIHSPPINTQAAPALNHRNKITTTWGSIKAGR